MKKTMTLNKKLITLCFTFTSYIFCFGQQNSVTTFQNKENNVINLSLNGNVKTLFQTSTTTNSNLVDTLTYKFDIYGFPIKIVSTTWGIEFSNGLTINNKKVFDFENGKLITMLEWEGDEKEVKNSKSCSKYEYDVAGNLIAKRYYFNNCTVSEVFQLYDNHDSLVKKSEYVYGYYNRKNKNRVPSNKSNYLSVCETYQYDSLGHVIAKSIDNIKGKIYHKSVYTYNDNGNKIEEGTCEDYKGINQDNDCKYKPLEGYSYDKNGRLIKKYQFGKWSPHNTDTYYQYDEFGNEIDVKGYYINEDTVLGYHYIYEYDKFGNQIMEEEKVGNYRRLGFDNYKSAMTQYDSFGNIIEQKYFTADGKMLKMISYNFTFDSYGNWIKKEKFEGTDVNQMTRTLMVERIIEYF